MFLKGPLQLEHSTPVQRVPGISEGNWGILSSMGGGNANETTT